MLHSLNHVLAVLITAIVLHSFGSMAVRSNELPDQINRSSKATEIDHRDWSFRLFQSLVKRYDCLSESAEATFDGTSQLERLEFAKYLNSCTEQMQDLVGIAPTDLETLKQLQTEFVTEITALKGKIERLDPDVAKLENQQFSTTTKLTGKAIFAINAGTFGGDRIIAPSGVIVSRNQPNVTSLYRISFDLDTSFNGTDLLKARLVAASTGSNDNAAGFLEPNFGSVLDFAIPGREQLSLGRLYYTFKPSQDLSVTIGSQMVAPDFVDKNRYANASFRDFSTTAITNNFILLPRPGGAGAVIEWKPDRQFSMRGVYIANSGSTNLPENQQFLGGGSPNDIRLFPLGGGGATGGLFGDPYLGVVEIEYAPTKSLTMRLQYSGGKLFGSTFGVIGANIDLTISPHIGIFARYGSGFYPNTTLGNIRPQYWSAGIAFRDLLTKTDLAGIGIAQPFVLSEVGNATQTNVEMFYNIPISSNLRISPIVQVITNPGNQNSNGLILTGTLRVVLSF